MTLAVRLGDPRTRALYVFLVVGALVALVGVVLGTTWWAALALAYLVPAGRAVSVVRRASGRDLVPALQLTGCRRARVRPRPVRGAVVGAA